MCGRFTLRTPASELVEIFELVRSPELEPRYNIAPGQPIGIVRPGAETFAREWALVRWGLVPSWAKDDKIGYRMINARGETAAEKPSFRAAFKRRRCLIPADGFFEWQRTSSKKKQPYFIGLEDQRPLAFAGLWESWTSPDGGELETATIITTESNSLIAPLHDRMPVILAPDEYGVWLDHEIESKELLTGLLDPYASEAMQLFAVDTYVNNARHEGPACVQPIDLPE